MEFHADLDVLRLRLVACESRDAVAVAADLHRDEVELRVAAELAAELVLLLRWRVEVLHHLAFAVRGHDLYS